MKKRQRVGDWAAVYVGHDPCEHCYGPYKTRAAAVRFIKREFPGFFKGKQMIPMQIRRVRFR
jgi:hypothetical protein